MNLVSSSRFSFADYVIINGAFFLCRVMLFWLFLERHPFLDIRQRDFLRFSRVERESKSDRVEKRRVILW